MGLTCKINFDGKRLAQRLQIDSSVLSAELMAAETEIIRRTAAQKGIEGDKFPALSEKYKKYKKAVGCKPVPDRTLTGDMLKAVSSKIENPRPDRVQGVLFIRDFPHSPSPRVGDRAKGKGKGKGKGKKSKGGAGRSSSSSAGSTTTTLVVAKAMQKLAPWFGLSQRQRARIVAAVKNAIGKR